MFAHITHVLMIRLNRYEGVITGGADHRMQDAIHVYSYVHILRCMRAMGNTVDTVVHSVSTHVARSRRTSEDNRPSENAVNPSEQRSPFSYQECDGITRRDKGCVAVCRIAERG